MCSDNIHKKKPYAAADNDIHYPAQTNHDTCFIPESVRQYASEPLHVIVARWCQQQRDWVQRRQVSEAFHITPARASYLITYLRNKASRVVSLSRHETMPTKVRRYEIYVIRVLENSEPARRKRRVTRPLTRRRVGNGDMAQANELWNRLRNAEKNLKKEDEDDGV